MKNDVLQNYLVQFLKYLAENFENKNFKMQVKLQLLDHQIVTSRFAIHKYGLFTLYLKGNGIKNSKFGKS